MFKFILLSTALLLSLGTQAAVFELEGQTPGVPKEAVVQRLRQLEDFVPPKMKQLLKSPILLQFQNLPVHGYNRRQSIVLAQSLLGASFKETQSNSLFNRTVLHELAHVYDGLQFIPREASELKTYCQQAPQGAMRDPQCAYWPFFTTTLSTNPHYLGKAGWLPNLNTTSVVSEKNDFKYRSPDEYELQSPQEHFAVNFEYFTTDPEFKCRRPTLYRYLQNHFEFEPFKNTNCDNTFVYAQPGETAKPLRTLDMKRLYKIDYLFASQAKSMMSKWGHAMLRLVFCAPNKPLDDRCYLDTGYHVVISYRAFVNTPEVNMIDGSTGKYPSRVFLTSLLSIINEYNKQDLRDLKAMPLNLTRAEMEQVVQRAIETHWSYSGMYYFKSNNCATETFNLVRSSLDRSNLYEYNPLHPKELWDVFQKSGLSDKKYAAAMAERTSSREQGLFYESFAPRYQAALKRLKIAADFAAYKTLPFQSRQRLWPVQAIATADVAAEIILEEAVYLSKRDEIIQRATQKHLQEIKNTTTPDVSGSGPAADYNRMLNASSVFSAPYMLLIGTSNSYGLPSPEERTKIISLLSEKDKVLSQFIKQAQELAEKPATFEEEQELQQTYQNIQQSYRKLQPTQPTKPKQQEKI
jgi:hypothetical protein